MIKKKKKMFPSEQTAASATGTWDRLRGFSVEFKVRAVPIGTVLNLRRSTSQKCEAGPRRACIQGAETCVSLKSRLESNREEEDKVPVGTDRIIGNRHLRYRGTSPIRKRPPPLRTVLDL